MGLRRIIAYGTRLPLYWAVRKWLAEFGLTWSLDVVSHRIWSLTKVPGAPTRWPFGSQKGPVTR
jgi:hypothetical protein